MCKVAASQNTWCIQKGVTLDVLLSGALELLGDYCHKIILSSTAEESKINTCRTWSFDFEYRTCRTSRQLDNKQLKN